MARGLVVVVGGDTMGLGIAHGFLAAGFEVALVETDPAARRRAHEALRETLARTGALGRLSEEPVALLERLEVREGLSGLRDVRLAIEAVPEDLSLNARLLGDLKRAVGAAPMLATNTSSISIAKLASGIRWPRRFLGLHFFNPVPASRLVEVVVGPATDEAAQREAGRLVAALGKQPVVVRDSPGFASSRLGVLLGLEAVRMVEEGVASPEDIDLAMTLGYRHPVGPLHLTDLVGIDVRLGIASYLETALGPRFHPPELLRRMVVDGRLGRKTGRGFFSYPDQGAATGP